MRLKKGKSVYRLPPNDGVLEVLVRRSKLHKRIHEPTLRVPLIDIRYVTNRIAAGVGTYPHPFVAFCVDRELQLYPAPDFGGHLTVTYRPMPRTV